MRFGNIGSHLALMKNYCNSIMWPSCSNDCGWAQVLMVDGLVMKVDGLVMKVGRLVMKAGGPI